MQSQLGSGPSRSPIPGLSQTERDLLLALRVAPHSSVKHLAQAVSLSDAGVRGPLARLEASGLITHDLAGEGPGRRRHAYRLTDLALRLFPNHYEDLWRELARFLRERYPEAWDEFWGEGLQRRLETFPRRLNHQTPQDALQSLKDFYESRDFIVATELQPGEGTGSLTVYHCPYLGIAKENPLICELEHQALGQALGGFPVERLAHQLDGQSHCQYLVRFHTAAQP